MFSYRAFSKPCTLSVSLQSLRSWKLGWTVQAWCRRARRTVWNYAHFAVLWIWHVHSTLGLAIFLQEKVRHDPSRELCSSLRHRINCETQTMVSWSPMVTRKSWQRNVRCFCGKEIRLIRNVLQWPRNLCLMIVVAIWKLLKQNLKPKCRVPAYLWALHHVMAIVQGIYFIINIF